MRDDKFNNLMKKYVDSTKRGEEIDLQKLRNKGQDKVKEHRSRTKFVWATCAAILIVVISLSIALPVVLNKEEVPEFYYCDLLDINKIEINEFSELIDQHNFSCMLPTIEFTDTYMYVMSNKDDNKDIGAFINLAIYDENFDSITFNLVKKQYIMVQFQYYDNFNDSVKWRDTTIKYLISEKNDDYYSYEMTFTMGNYNYYINFDIYSVMPVTELLDMIYCKNVNE